MTDPQNFSDMGELFQKIMENPEMLSRAVNLASTLASSGVLNGLLNKNEHPNPTNSSDSKTEATAPQQSPLTNLFSALGKTGDTNPNFHPQTPNSMNTPPPDSTTKTIGHKAGHRERIALLEAMRPFISPEKKERLELLIRLLGVMEIAEELGIGKSPV